jgi:hypothetical protein
MWAVVGCGLDRRSSSNITGITDPGYSLPGVINLEGKISGDGTPGRLPLISRFSRPSGWQPVGDAASNASVEPVNLALRTGTFILVNWDRSMFPVHALSLPNSVLACSPPGGLVNRDSILYPISMRMFR